MKKKLDLSHLTQTTKSLTRLLRELPDEVIFDPTSKKVQFNRIFAEVLRLRKVSTEDIVRLEDLWGDKAPNLSSFQRAVAKEVAVRKERLDLPTTREGNPPKSGGSSGGTSGESTGDGGGESSEGSD